MKKGVQTAGVCLCSRIKTSEKCGVMVGVGRNRGKPLVPPDRHFGFFLAVEKETPLRRAERKVGLREFFYTKKYLDKGAAKELERENILLPQSASLTAPSEKEPDFPSHSTVTDLAKFLGLSMSQPLFFAVK